MGPEDKAGLKDFTLFLGGVPVMRGNVELTRSGQPAEEPVRTLPCECVKGSLTVRNPKRWRCRSRKRFIKLIMSEGIDRNGAEWVADFVRGWMTYGEAWLGHLLRDLRGSDDLRWVKQMKSERMKRNAENEKISMDENE